METPDTIRLIDVAMQGAAQAASSAHEWHNQFQFWSGCSPTHESECQASMSDVLGLAPVALFSPTFNVAIKKRLVLFITCPISERISTPRTPPPCRQAFCNQVDFQVWSLESGHGSRNVGLPNISPLGR